MAIIEERSWAIDKPTGRLKFNRNHPLARNMQHGWFVLESRHNSPFVLNLVRDTHHLEATYLNRPIRYEKGANDLLTVRQAGATATRTYLLTSETDLPGIEGESEFTVIAFGQTDETSNKIIASKHPSGWYMAHTSTTNLRFTFQSTAGRKDLNITTSAANLGSVNDWRTQAMVYDGSEAVHRGYINGREVGSIAHAGAGTVNANSSKFAYAGYVGSDSWTWEGPVTYCYLYNRCLTEGELLALTRNPVQVFERRIWVPFSAVSPGETAEFTEAISMTESPVSLAAAFGQFSEALTLPEAITASAATFGQFSGDLTVSEAVTASAAAAAGIAENMAAGDIDRQALAAGLATVIEQFLASEAMQASLGLQQSAVTEGLIASDLLEAIGQAASAITLGATLGEAWVGETITAQEAAFTAGTQASESFLAAVNAIAEISETANLDAVILGLVTSFSAMAEGMTLQDVWVGALTTVSGQLTAAIQLDDAWSVAQQIQSTITEAISLDVVLMASSAATAVLSEAITLSAEFIGEGEIAQVSPGSLILGAISIGAIIGGMGNISPIVKGKPTLN